MRANLDDLLFKIIYLEKCKLVEEMAGQYKKQMDYEWKIIDTIKRIKKDKCKKLLELLVKEYEKTQDKIEKYTGNVCKQTNLKNALFLGRALQEAIATVENSLNTEDCMER